MLEGGEGTDLVTYASRADDVTAAIGATREDEIAGDVEDLTGGLGSDTLTGDAGPNVLRGGDDGDDTFFGGVGPGPGRGRHLPRRRRREHEHRHRLLREP